MLKIDNAASTGSHGKYINMLASLGLRRWQHMIVKGLHEHCTATEVTGCIKTILIPKVQLCPSAGTIPFKLCTRQFPIRIVFALTINKFQDYMLERVAIYLPSPVFPMARSIRHFPDPLHLTTSLLQLLRDIDNVQRMTEKLMYKKHCISRHALIFQYINKALLIKYCIVFTCELFALVRLVFEIINIWNCLDNG
jgi:hypothetical protein